MNTHPLDQKSSTSLCDPGEDHALSAEGICFSYRNRPTLKGVSFQVRHGELCGLLGPNGSGKTTLLKCMNGLLSPSAGRIAIGGHEISRLSREEVAQRIAMVPQELSIVFPFTVLQMVLMGGSVRFGISGVAKAKDHRHAREVLGELGIEHLSERRYTELSGGEKQMVLIARALFQGTGILLLDEPTSHLDFKRQFTILETIRRVTRERGLTTIMTLHDPNAAGAYCDRLIMLSQGKILHQGLRSEVFHVASLEMLYDMKIHMGSTDTGAEYVTPVYEA